MGNALLAFASPKAALTWASTFSGGEAPEAIPALAAPRRWSMRWIAAAVAALATAGTIAWGTLRAPAPRTIETPPDELTSRRPELQRQNSRPSVGTSTRPKL
jgi:hypothetical protein